MKEIIATSGQRILVDNEDYPFLNRYSWSLCGRGEHLYAQAGVGPKVEKLHRLIMDAPEGVEIDFIDGNKLNCQKANLRFASSSQNKMNSQKRQGCSSKFKGVCRHKSGGWTAYCNGKYIGYFQKEVDAAKAYNNAAMQAFGSFARLNPI